MSDLLSIGASGVRAHQSALTTVSENIANSGVAGFSRRTATLSEVGAVGGGVAVAGNTSGYGVVVTGVSRASDMFKAASVRQAATDLAKTETGSVWLERIQFALTGPDLSASLTTFFNAAKSVAADPSSLAPRAVMLENAAAVAAGFAATGDALAQVTADLDGMADQAAANLNSLGTALAKINDAMSRAGTNTAASANLSDRRDQILEQMSALVDISATIDPVGRATVRAGGAGGPVLVAGTEAGSVSYSRNAQGAVSFAVSRAGTAAVLSPNGGALAGVADGAQRIADARASLDVLATQFVDGVNDVQAQGRDLNGAGGAAMFAVGATPSDIRVMLTDPSGVAAASAGGGTRDNSNLARLESLRASGGFEMRLTSAVASNAAGIESRRTVAEAQSAIHDGAILARDAVSGVDLDDEAVDLLRFQQAYQASSRIIQVARETFQSIIGIN
ncbi:flagellar hook-associated protein FlgK [Sphingomonas sp. SUN019]|uniref:flagellar hook-associated protein FlgK n=1 Tax=Sphingomonas sp. SUN019 TaxID=2937788 RepID=UPI002164430B|nr:flagellar hook-associated protein FlgK [Sphingomonas sp. SUN019]UVO51245.1 flagellar hook-associated protein FlgK [Sphingomonas sp. SUN019]